MIKLHISLDAHYKITSGVAGSLNQFSNAKVVVHFPSLQTSPVLYAWVTPNNLTLPERQLIRDADEDYDENDKAYVIDVYPGMTLGLTAQQDTGFALLRVRLGNVLSPLIKIPVLKSLAPGDTEMPPTIYENIAIEVADHEVRITQLEENVTSSAVRVDLAYTELTSAANTDKFYVNSGGTPRYITRANLLGDIEFNANVGTTSTDPNAVEETARTWFTPTGVE